MMVNAGTITIDNGKTILPLLLPNLVPKSDVSEITHFLFKLLKGD